MKRYVTISEYCRNTGISYATADYLMKSGQLPFITTEGGLRRIDTQEQNSDNAALFKRLDAQERMLKALCAHLGIASNSFEYGGQSGNVSYIAAK